MRLISFEQDGRASFGIVVDGGVINAGARLRNEFAGLREVLLAGAVNRLRGMEGLAPDLALDDVGFLPVIPDPAAKLLCVGVNYMPHIREMGREKPDYPVIFVRFADSIVGHGRAMIRPRASERYDYEGELAVIIGRDCRDVAEADAGACVAGYAAANDVSARWWQRHGAGGQFVRGKSFDTFCPLGAMTPAAMVGDPQALELVTRLDGAVVQRASTSAMIFPVMRLIAELSRDTTLLGGTVILTGTPSGVGAARTPPRFLRDGDVVEVEIAGVGTVRNPVKSRS